MKKRILIALLLMSDIVAGKKKNIFTFPAKLMCTLPKDAIFVGTNLRFITFALGELEYPEKGLTKTMDFFEPFVIKTSGRGGAPVDDVFFQPLHEYRNRTITNADQLIAIGLISLMMNLEIMTHLYFSPVHFSLDKLAQKPEAAAYLKQYSGKEQGKLKGFLFGGDLERIKTIQDWSVEFLETGDRVKFLERVRSLPDDELLHSEALEMEGDIYSCWEKQWTEMYEKRTQNV